jgi:uncharacterized MAPEG superfamily protein
MENFAPYGLALVSLAAVGLLGLLLSPLSALKKQASGLITGAAPAEDYADPAYRWNRAFMNLTETYGYFAGITVAAMLAGVSPFWVNLIAVIFLVTRLVVAFVHIRGIGQQTNGPRTVIYVVGWFAALVLAVLTVIAIYV